jgi:hypothetical protein
MLEKKLVTLLCAAGILACGACFLPPLPQRPPPPPPPHLDLQGIQSIRVEVTNNSESHHLDPSDLAQAVANSINWQGKETRVDVHVQKEACDDDAVLAIVIVNESAALGATAAKGDPNKEWLFEVKISATLTRKDGQVVWSETDSGPRFSRKLAQTDPAEVWNDPIVRNSLTLALGNRLVYRMLYVH